MDKYILREELGSGTFGVVHKAEHCETKEIVAVKCIRERWTQDGILQCVLREMSILRQLQHPHIVQLKDVIMTKLHTALVFEYLSKDLGAYIREIPPGKLMEESQLKTFFYQMALAVCFFHRRGVIHRDLKPANVLIVNDIHLKVADFGSSKEIEIPIQDDHPKVVTLSYRAPELLLGCKSQSMAVDVWSLGCIVAEMALKERFFHREVKNKEFPEMDQLTKIYQVLGKPTEQTWPGVSKLPYFDRMRDVYYQQYSYSFHTATRGTMSMRCLELLKKIFVLCPERRITCKDILCHRYFESVDKDQ